MVEYCDMWTKEQAAKNAREYRLRRKLGLHQPKRGENLRKHGVTKSPEHRSWLSMMTRCVWSGPERSDYHLYQGKNIAVCERWLEFTAFLEDMGKKPTPKHTIERLDSDKNYEPGNCVWATPKEQSANRNDNRRIEFNGESLILADWARRIGICSASLSERLRNWPLEKALTVPPVRRRERSSQGVYAPAFND